MDEHPAVNFDTLSVAKIGTLAGQVGIFADLTKDKLEYVVTEQHSGSLILKHGVTDNMGDALLMGMCIRNSIPEYVEDNEKLLRNGRVLF